MDGAKSHVGKLLQAATQRMPIPSRTDKEALKTYHAYSDRFIDLLNTIYFNVSPALHVRHIQDTNEALREPNLKPKFRALLQDSKKRITITYDSARPFLNYIEATGCMDELTKGPTPEDSFHYSARFSDINRVGERIVKHVWQGLSTSADQKALAALLYMPNEPVNVTLDAESAIRVAQDVVEAAQQAKSSTLGLAPRR